MPHKKPYPRPLTWLITVFIPLIFFLHPSCKCFSEPPPPASYPLTSPPLEETGIGDFQLDGDLKTFTVTKTLERPMPGVTLYTFTLESPQAAEPPRFSIRWKTPSLNVHGFWTPNISLDKSTYYQAKIKTRAVRYAPALSLFSQEETNRLTLAVSDTLNSLEVETELIEEDICFHHAIHFFQEKHPNLKKYTVTIRLDKRSLHFSQSLRDVSAWWESLPGHQPAAVPETARQPMYSTWYSFHQNISAQDVEEQCKLAHELGFEAVIVDDGWQTLDNKRGYAYTGDWEPDRIPDMKALTDKVHQMGMKFLLWYSVPLMGEKAKKYDLFKQKFLYYWEGQGAYVLDPRYPDVREFIINTYIRAVTDWNLDGLKLDFIDMFRPGPDTELTAANGRDYASVEQAADRLMTDLMRQLRTLKPDIMIEFRQPYIGPLMRKYGNMFRAADCPNMALVNRVRTTDIRLLCGNTAVHSDMFRWRDKEQVEMAALQILNIIFSVPQLSISINRFPQEYRDMIKFWIGYWRANREVLLDGLLTPAGVQENYSAIKSVLANKKTIVALYSHRIITVEKYVTPLLDIINAKLSDSIWLETAIPLKNVIITIFNCKGVEMEKKTATLSAGVHVFKVPPSGLLQLHRKK